MLGGVGGWVGGGSHFELLGLVSKNNLSAPPPWQAAYFLDTANSTAANTVLILPAQVQS